MRHGSLISSTVALAVAVLAGCDDRVVDPSILWIESNYSGVVTIARSIDHRPDGSATIDRITATFQDYGGAGLGAGAISVDGLPLRIDTAHVGGFPRLAYVASSDRDDLTIPFGGASISVVATGSDRIPAFEDSIASIADELVLAAPAPASSVAGSGGLGVEWSATSDRRTRVEIAIEPVDDAAGAPSRRRALASDLDDDGAHHVPAWRLEQLAITAGSYRLIVTRSVARPIVIEGNKRVLLVAASEARSVIDIDD